MQDSYEQVKNTIFGLLSSRVITFRREFVDLAGSASGAIFLQQAFYWTGRGQSDDGWFYKTREEWTQETGLTRYEQESARKALKELGVLEEDKRGVPCRVFYRINLDQVFEILSRNPSGTTNKLAENPQLDGGKQPTSRVDSTNFNKEAEMSSEMSHNTDKTDIHQNLLPGMDGTDVIKRVFDYFVVETEKHPKLYTLTDSRLSMGRARFKDCMRITGGNAEKAEKLMRLVVDTLVESDFHMARGDYKGRSKYNDWKHIFGSTDKLEQWIERSRQ